MYILEVIPIANLPPQVPQLLSYFFSKELPKGAIVEVVIGNRKVLAVVISSEPAENQKILLKKSSFQLKKISSIVSETPLVSETQFKIALWLSQNYFSPLGMCLKTVLPPFFLKQNLEPRMLNLEKSKFHLSGQEIQNSKLLLSRAKNIIKNITSEIKKTLRDKKQILLVVAEIIIGTRQALFAPFTNLGLIIVEDPSNEAYKSDMSPKYNTVSLVKKIAKIYSAKLLFVSQAPDVDQYLL